MILCGLLCIGKLEASTVISTLNSLYRDGVSEGELARAKTEEIEGIRGEIRMAHFYSSTDKLR